MAKTPLAHDAEEATPLHGTGTANPAPEGGFALGRPALEAEIAAWDIDIRPDGHGLPEGSGDVAAGEDLYIDYCAACHGDFGEAIGRWPALSGGEDTLASRDPVKTTGSYWPYLSTVYDYIHRAMPFGNAQSLSDDEVYALTAYVLYLNFLADEDFTLSKENFAGIDMPNAGGFFMDDRAEVELPRFSREVCMTDCKDEVKITMRARVLDVTPDGDEATEASAEDMPDPALVAEGKQVFAQCRACHQVGDGARNRSGPHLNSIVGRQIGGLDGFRYSRAMTEAGAGGDVWTERALAAYLADPRDAVPGTKMAFRGLRNDADIAAVTAYLTTFAE